jgi:BMFP domain-containing protein YqiC
MRLVFSERLRYQIAMTDESIENIARKLAEAVPEGLKSMREDLERNFRSVLQTSLTKLDLVTREEFEVQEAVLAKTRSKLEALEARLKEMEESEERRSAAIEFAADGCSYRMAREGR